jgi:serine/threonine protein kinase
MTVSPLLPSASLCNGKYTIESVTGVNDSGVTYRARSKNGNGDVCILQYSPTNVADTDADANRQKFIDDARLLASFNHENIVAVLALFAENDVVYMVIPCVEGLTQKELLKVGSDLPKYVPEIERTKEYLKSQGVAEDLLPRKPHFLYLPDYKVMLVHFGVVQVFSKTPDSTPDEKASSEKMSPPEKVLPDEKMSSEKTPPVQPNRYKAQYAALACPACKRPLPICICHSNKHVIHN